MNIAGYKIHSILTSHFRLDGGAMFGIIPKPLWNKKMPSDDLNRIQMITRSLLLIGHGKIILVDSGNGDKWQEKFKRIYDIDTTTANIDSSLAKLGYTAEDITDIICSHLHFDHIGGNTKYEDNKIIPTFPNAKHWMHQNNWNLANSPSEKDQGSFMEDDWKVLAENDMISIVKGNDHFLPNIDFILSDGHTTGMMLPVVSDNDNTLVYCADLIPTSSHIPLPWVMAYDIQPTVTISEKKHLYSTAVENNWILFFEHDPKIVASTISGDGNQYNLNKIIEI